VIECPDYSNHGQCAPRKKGTCPLPHVDRAHTLRKAAKRRAKTGSDDESDVSSNDEHQISDDEAVHYDSDGPEEEDEQMILDGDGQDLLQQQDFVSFG